MTPQSYRKRPVVVEAMQWDGSVESATAVIDWILGHDGTARYYDDPILSINTRRPVIGTVDANPGDYVIRGVQGEFYPCKPDIFAATYEDASTSPVAADAGLDAARVEAALRAVVSDLDYDLFKSVERDESDGTDRFPSVARLFMGEY